jgi:hypothetical protein
MVGGAAAGLPGLHRARHPQGAPGSQGPGEGCEYPAVFFSIVDIAGVGVFQCFVSGFI